MKRKKVAFICQPEYFSFIYEGGLSKYFDVKAFPFKFSSNAEEFRSLINFAADYNFFFRGEYFHDSILSNLKGIKIALSSEPFPNKVDGKWNYSKDSIRRYYYFRKGIRYKPFDYVFHYDGTSLDLFKLDNIGADGQLGSDLVKNCPRGIELIKSTLADLDLTQYTTIKKRIVEEKADWVINTAAYVKVDEAEKETWQAYQLNSVSVGYLSLACQEANSRLVHFSTDFVFDGRKGAPYTEDDQPNPLNTYGMSKWIGEVLSLNQAKSYVVRLAFLYGLAGSQGKKSNIVYAILNKARETGEVRAIEDIFISPTYSFDAASGIWQLIDSGKPLGIYHMTNDGACSLYEFASAIVDRSGVKAQVIPITHDQMPSAAVRPLYSALSSTKGTTLRPWREALDDFIDSLHRG